MTDRATVARLDQLLIAGRIGLDVWLIAHEYRRLCLSTLARGGPGVARGGPIGFGGGATGLAVTVSHAARLAEVNRAIGADAVALLRAVLVDELSWRAIGRRLGVHHETAEAWAITALAALAEAWRRPQRRAPRRQTPGTAREASTTPLRPGKRVAA